MDEADSSNARSLAATTATLGQAAVFGYITVSLLLEALIERAKQRPGAVVHRMPEISETH